MRISISRQHTWMLAATLAMMLASGRYVAAQEAPPDQKQAPPLERRGPSAVAPTSHMLAAASAGTMLILAAAFATYVLRMSKRKPPRSDVREVMSVVALDEPITIVPVDTSDVVSTLAHRPAHDELPIVPAARNAGNVRVSIAGMEAFARSLRLASQGGRAEQSLYQRLRQTLLSVDAAGYAWTIGIQSGTWYRAETGRWIARMPPHAMLMEEAAFQKLSDLESAFT